MKIIHCLKYFLPEQVAGTEVYILALCKALNTIGNESIVVKPNYSLLSSDQYFYEGVRVVEYPESNEIDHELFTGRRLPNGLAEFEKILLSEKPDCINFHEISGSNGITIHHLKVAQDLKITVFTTLHLSGYVCKTGTFRFKDKSVCNGIIDKNKCGVCLLHNRGLKWGIPEIIIATGNRFYKTAGDSEVTPGKLERLFSYPNYVLQHKTILNNIFNISEQVFVLSKWFKKVLLDNNMPEQKITYVETGLPYLPIFSEYTPCLRTAPLHFVYVGRITKIKGLDIALKALSQIDPGKWFFDIYGKVTEPEFEIYCKKLISGNMQVNWKGILPPSKVVKCLQLYDAMIFPTVVEEMSPLVIQEAFAANLPVIAGDVKGNAEQITDGLNSWLFKFNNIEDLKLKLQMLIDNPALITEVKKNIPHVRSFNNVAADYLNVYQRLSLSYNDF